MRVAVIDLGTNTFHLMLAEVEKGNHKIFLRERVPVKIGEKGITKGKITQPAWDRAINTLKEFKLTIEKNNVSKTFATATSAIRNAKNGKALTEEIKKTTGIEIEIISGLREAELIHLGAKEALDLGAEKSLIMDIGGGSIEFIIADAKKTYWMQSFEVGGQRLVETFHKNDPISEEEIQELHAFFEKELIALFEAHEQYVPKTLIGCSGTFDTLSEIHSLKNGITVNPDTAEYPLSIAAFREIYPDIVGKNRAERLEIPGMIKMRVDMIVVASVLIEYILRKLDLSSIRVSAYALKEGILFNVLHQFQAD